MDLCYKLRDYNLSRSAMLAYNVLEALSNASAARGKSYTYISRKSLGERIGRSERTAQRAVKELERERLVVVKRMGRTLNDHIFVFPPRMPQEEKERQVKAADHSVYGAAKAPAAAATPSCPAASMAGQEPSKMAGHNNNGSQKINNNRIDKSINPGKTMKKGRATPRQVRINKAEREKIVRKYRDFFQNSLRLEEIRKEWVYVDNTKDVAALEKVIDFMANTMARKTKIAVNGTLLTPLQWFEVAKHLKDEDVFRIIYKMPRYKARNPQAYLLSAIYNEALQTVIQEPFYDSNTAIFY